MKTIHLIKKFINTDSSALDNSGAGCRLFCLLLIAVGLVLPPGFSLFKKVLLLFMMIPVSFISSINRVAVMMSGYSEVSSDIFNVKFIPVGIFVAVNQTGGFFGRR